VNEDRSRDERTSGSAFPGPVRLRRLRFSPGMRALVRETDLLASDLIYPLFVRPGVGVKKAIVSMPGQFQWSPDTAVEEPERPSNGRAGGRPLRDPRVKGQLWQRQS
jgi:hypothetical protein